MGENQNNFKEEDSLQLSIDLRDQVDKYLPYWKWFLLSLIICLLFAFIKLKFTASQYRTASTIQIRDTEGRERESQLAAFKDLGITTRSNNMVEDEMEVLKSKSLITKTIKELNLNIQFFTNESSITKFFDDNLGLNIIHFKTENYKDQPININFLGPTDLIYQSASTFIITITSENEYILEDLENGSDNKYSFGDKIKTNVGDIIITPNFNLSNTPKGSNVLVKVIPLASLIRYYTTNLEISQLSEFSSILNLALVGSSKEKSEEFLNTLVKIYNAEAVEYKNDRAEATAEFVKTRLEKISNELTDVDMTAEEFKQRNKLSDIASETSLNLQSGMNVENQLVDASTQIQLVQSMKDYISSKENDELVPLNLGFEDNAVNDISQKYNELILEKNRLLKSSTEKNPIVQNLNEQINLVKNTLDQSLGNLEVTKKISLDALIKQNSSINSKIYSAPRKERQYRDIQRQQQIKENLFLYILQKREQSAITLGASSAPAKIVDVAESKDDPVLPKKPMFYLAALILGGIVPFSTIYLKNILDTKVHTKEDVEKVLSIPILGDIPKLESKKSFLISQNDASSMAEAFRILRTNLNFLLTQTNKKGKTIFVTSTIAHEGKSLVATNLAASLGFAGKKTLIIGMDIRAPRIKPYLGIRGAKGVTNYIIDKELLLEDIILKVPQIMNLDLISSGDIPPNPAELLMHSRVKELFDLVKKEYDYIIVDTAASSMVTDTMLLQEYADAFVYVIRANFLDKRRLRFIHSLYKDNRLPNMALLVNGVDHKKSYGYGYGYGYGPSAGKPKKNVRYELDL